MVPAASITLASFDLASHWGAGLRTARTDAGLTLADLAHRAGTSPQAVQQFESGRRIPLDPMKVALAAALGTTPGALFPWPPLADLVAEAAA